MGKKEESWKMQKNGTKGAHMAAASSPIPGIDSEEFSACRDYFKMRGESSQAINEEKLPTVNMAGLTFEDADWDG